MTAESPLAAAPPPPDHVALAFRRGAYACFIIAVLPAGIGIALLAAGVDMPTAGKVGPFLWTAALAGVGFGLLKCSMAGVWAGLLVCVGGGLALLGYAIFGGGNRAGFILPIAILFLAVPRLWRLRQMLLASR